MGRLFLWDLNIFVILCEREEEKCEKIGQFSGTNISRTTKAISFNFDMWSYIYVRQKICKFGKNRYSSFGDTEG